MSNIEIRSNIKPGDIGSIIKMHGEYYSKKNGFDETFEPYVAIPLAEFVLRKKENEKIWIVEKDKEIKGCIAIVDHGERTAQLRWYILDESIQGQGIGKELIKKALCYSKEMKYQKVILWTIDEQEKAIKVYKKNGFILKEEKKHHLWSKEVNEQCYEIIIK
jgi:RimJ/RimL family protein N-acetyltransferase